MASKLPFTIEEINNIINLYKSQAWTLVTSVMRWNAWQIKDKCIPKLIQSVMDNGGLNTPLRIRVV